LGVLPNVGQSHFFEPTVPFEPLHDDVKNSMAKVKNTHLVSRIIDEDKIKMMVKGLIFLNPYK